MVLQGKAKKGKEEDKEEDDIEEEQDDIDIEEEQDNINIDIDIKIENGGVNFQHSAGSPVGPQSSS